MTLRVLICGMVLMFACTQLAHPAPAHAQAEKREMFKALPMPAVDSLVPLPDEMQQLWIMRNCEKGKLSFRFSRRFLLASDKSGSKIFRLGGVGDLGNNRYSMTMPGERTGLMLASDGRLIQYFGDLNMSFSRDQLEARKIMIPHVFHLNCTDAEKVYVNEDPILRSLMPALDNMQEACAHPQDIRKKTCQQSIFAVFDQDLNKLLDEAELLRAWDILIAYSPFGVCGEGVTPADSLRSDGSAYVTWLMTHADKNKDSQISFDEFLSQWQTMQTDPLMSGFTNVLIAADRSIGILPEEIKVSCVNCCVSAR